MRVTRSSHILKRLLKSGRAWAWWCSTWHAACAEVRARFGDGHEVRVPVVPRERGEVKKYTMSNIFARLHIVPNDDAALDLWKTEVSSLHSTLARRIGTWLFRIGILIFFIEWASPSRPRYWVSFQIHACMFACMHSCNHMQTEIDSTKS